MFPGLQHHAGKYYGKYSGTVIDNADADNLGRVSVNVPTIFGPNVNVPARPCMPYGHFFVPEIGTQVWVEFEAGDVQYPIWVGTWPQGGATPAPAAVSPPDNRVIQTASGHTIEIMDKQGEEKITIKHKGNAFISIDKNGSVLVSNQTGSYLQLDADGAAASLVEQHGNMLTMGADGIVLAGASGKTMLQMTDDTVRISATAIILQAPSVSLTGDPAAASTFVITPDFTAQWNLFMMHVHPTALGPSGPPTPPGPLIVPGVPFVSSGAVLK